MATVIPFPLHRSEPNVAHYRVACEVGEETGITVRVMAKVAWPYDLLVTLAGTCEEIAAATQLANAVLVALEAAEITWSLQRSARERIEG